MSRRILILSTSAGAGHLRAAQAIELALRELDSTAVIDNRDVLTLTNAAFRRLYGQAYLDLVNRAPHMLGYFYDMMDRPRSSRSKSDKLRVAFETLNMAPFVALLKSQPWDIVVNTHFLPAELIAALRRKRTVRVPHFTVTTDFETHRLWVNQPCEHFFTATDEGAAYLEHFGVPRSDISVTGIPIHPVFSQTLSRQECMKRLGLAGDRPVVLQLTGGFGVGPVEAILRGILSIETPLDIVVVAGRNEEARQKLQRIKSATHRVKVLGFTDQMDEWMGAADLVVSKPGGLTTSEALARGTAMAVVNPIPGQESRNSDFLLENGAAIKINNIATLPHKLAPLLANPARLAELREHALRLGRPRAAFDIAQKVLRYR